MNSTPVVITGYGAITPLGLNASSTWNALLKGTSGVSLIERFNPEGFPVQFAAEIKQMELLMSDSKYLNECQQSDERHARFLSSYKGFLTHQALVEALSMAQLREVSLTEEQARRTSVVIGSEAGRPDLGFLVENRNRLPSLEELQALSPQAPAQYIASKVGAKGFSRTVSTACTSSSQACGEGMLLIKRGLADIVVVGGVDVLVDPIMVTGFSLLGALSTRNDDPRSASRPFDRDRDGFVLGEGAGILVLESEEHALKRGVDIQGRLSGYGCSCNAYRITDSPPDGRGAAQSMAAALRSARLNPEQIGYINAHGTSTKMNDSSESRGIERTLGADVPVSSTKSMMGHLVAACGSVEAIISLFAVQQGVLPPTTNLDNVDINCDLHHIQNQAEERQIEHAMTNAFGFGGSNGTLILSRY